MGKVILKVENISKQYRLGVVGTGSLIHDLNRFWYRIRGKEDPYLKIGSVNDRSVQATEDYVWALRDINFEVEQGEVLGIIGKNGAGKSTLLKLLSRVTSPTTGIIKSKGRIASLLEVGTGFHPELTGRENIYLNGAILGMTKAEITAKIDEIVAFSGCEMYIDTPTKRYSSGMTVRLAFAVAAHLEPDILVVDEVLAVGDAEFQKKAIGKMQEISGGDGRTVLFVSHNMGSVKALCTKVMTLENGRVNFLGPTNEGVDVYLNQESTQVHPGIVQFTANEKGSEYFILTEVRTSDNQNRVRSVYSQSDEIKVSIKFEVLEDIEGARFNLRVKTIDEVDVFMTSSHYLTQHGLSKGEHELELTIPPFLFNTQRYILTINAGVPGRFRIVDPFDALFIDIESDNTRGSLFREKWPGVVSPKIEWLLK